MIVLGVGVALVCKVMISLLKVKEVGPSTWNSSFKSLLRVMFGFTCGLGTSQFLLTYLYNICFFLKKNYIVFNKIYSVFSELVSIF